MICIDDAEGMFRSEGTEWVTPDVRPELIADINVSPALSRWRNELIEGARVQYELAVLRQRKIKEYCDRLELVHMDGIGKRVASFDPELFHRLELVRGRGWWRDKKELHRVLHDNPFLQLRCVPATFTIRIDGFRDQEKTSGSTGARGHATQPSRHAGFAGGQGKGDPAGPVLNTPRLRRGEQVECSGHEIAARSCDSRRPENGKAGSGDSLTAASRASLPAGERGRVLV